MHAIKIDKYVSRLRREMKLTMNGDEAEEEEEADAPVVRVQGS